MDAERWCACGAGLRTVVTVGGRRRELEVEPHPDGNHVMQTVSVVGGGLGLRARVLTGRDLPTEQTAYRMHRCTEPQLLCSECREEMTYDIAKALGWTMHPCCEPWFQAEILRERVATRRRVFRDRRNRETA